MTDPFGALRLDVPAVDPDPDFTTRLRARLQRALTLPRGVAVSTTAVPEAAIQDAVLGAAVPYLAVGDARAAIEWYVDVFGAEVAYDPIVMPDGRVGHCELTIGGGKIYLADEHPEIGVIAPSPEASAVSLMLGVHDADAVRTAAMARGATGDREPYDGHGQPNAWIVDPFGHRWGLSSPLTATASTGGVHHGDVVYASVWAAEPTRAAAFYSAVLGWRCERNERGYDVAGTRLNLGIYAVPDDPGLFCCYAVDDLDAAVERVRAAGGTATDIDVRPYGRISDCTDDQGAPFALTTVPADAPEDRASNVKGQGDLTYITYEVADSKRFRAFYGSVLGWSFETGNVDDGWQVERSTPMAGVAGGSRQRNTVPMWEVDDIAAAVQRVRTAGGTATEPQQQSYGLMTECTDDQGTRFYLGQL
ncbi:MAG: glyoxalase [Actinomycetota bacterium]|nr:glyoxalase [Actinomycetota bacterium]